MGWFSNLFAPKISSADRGCVEHALRQCHETCHIINTTTSPSVFFGRLNFLLDRFLFLQQYEKYRVFKEFTPTQQYVQILDELEDIVNSFINRACQKALDKAFGLKTEKGQFNSLNRFANEILFAFENANDFWAGSNPFPHYTGALFTNANFQKINNIITKINERDLGSLLDLAK